MLSHHNLGKNRLQLVLNQQLSDPKEVMHPPSLLGYPVLKLQNALKAINCKITF